jgi:nucleoside-diphosphate-sugar epimerase
MRSDDGGHASTRDLAVLGGTGFLGRHFVAAARRLGRRVRMLVRDPAVVTGAPDACVHGDLDDAASLARLITPGVTVVNFAWSEPTAQADAVRQARQLAAVCREAPAHALLHCSTAGVFGGCDDVAVVADETTPRPADSYGLAKLAVDDTLWHELQGRVPLALLRPTAVFGAGGDNLVDLIAAIVSGDRLASYLRSCLFDRRFLHLVPVETVVEAFLFVEARVGPSGSRHLITADHEPLNRYRAMERHVMELFGVRDHRWPRVPLPPAALRLALRARRRAAALPFTRFDDDGLRALGFRPPVPFEAAVASFAGWYGTRPGAALRRRAPRRRATGAGAVS